MSLRKSTRSEGRRSINYREPDVDDVDIQYEDHDAIRKSLEFQRAMKSGSSVSYRDVLEHGAMRVETANRLLEDNNLYIFAMNTWCLENDAQIRQIALRDHVDDIFTEGWNMWRKFYDDHKGLAQQRILKEYTDQDLHRRCTPRDWVMQIKIWTGFHSKLPQAEECYDVLLEETPWGTLDPADFYSNPGNQARYPTLYRNYLESIHGV